MASLMTFNWGWRKIMSAAATQAGAAPCTAIPISAWRIAGQSLIPSPASRWFCCCCGEIEMNTVKPRSYQSFRQFDSSFATTQRHWIYPQEILGKKHQHQKNRSRYKEDQLKNKNTNFLTGFLGKTGLFGPVFEDRSYDLNRTGRKSNFFSFPVSFQVKKLEIGPPNPQK